MRGELGIQLLTSIRLGGAHPTKYERIRDRIRDVKVSFGFFGTWLDSGVLKINRCFRVAKSLSSLNNWIIHGYARRVSECGDSFKLDVREVLEADRAKQDVVKLQKIASLQNLSSIYVRDC